MQPQQGRGGCASALGITPPECKTESNTESFLRHSFPGHLYVVGPIPSGMGSLAPCHPPIRSYLHPCCKSLGNKGEAPPLYGPPGPGPCSLQLHLLPNDSAAPSSGRRLSCGGIGLKISCQLAPPSIHAPPMPVEYHESATTQTKVTKSPSPVAAPELSISWLASMTTVAGFSVSPEAG